MMIVNALENIVIVSNVKINALRNSGVIHSEQYDNRGRTTLSKIEV